MRRSDRVVEKSVEKEVPKAVELLEENGME